MKRIALLAVTLATACLPARSQVMLNAGETYTYQCSTLLRTGFTQFGAPSGLLAVGVNGDSLQLGEALRFEMFEDAPEGDPIFSRTVTAASGSGDFYGSVNGAWQDLQGSIRLTMVSGSARIDSFSVLALTVAGSGGLNQYSRLILPEPGPTLHFAPSPSAMVRWPASATNFVLEATLTLLPPSQWQTVTNAIETVDGMLFVTVDHELPSRFFRLRRVFE